jgi:hypothetical protein
LGEVRISLFIDGGNVAGGGDLFPGFPDRVAFVAG